MQVLLSGSCSTAAAVDIVVVSASACAGVWML